MSLPILFGIFWSLLLLAGYLWLPRRLARSALRNGWIWVVGIALIARLVPLVVLPGGATYDIQSYQIVGDLVLRGQDVYAAPEAQGRHPYLPLQMYWMAAAEGISNRFNIPYPPLVKLPAVLADMAIAAWLWRAFTLRNSPQKGIYAGVGYALNPLTVFVSVYHGQFDAIPVFLTLLAIRATIQQSGWAGGWLGLAILDKSWPVLALPSLLAGARSWSRRLLLVGLAVFIPLAGVGVYWLVFRGNPITVISRALSYNRGVAVWGYTYLLRLSELALPQVKGIVDQYLFFGSRFVTLAILGSVWWLKARKQPVRSGVLTMLVVFFAATHAFAIQYLMWVVAFALLDEDNRWLAAFTVAAFIYMIFVYNTYILEMHIDRILPLPQADLFLIIPSGLPAWAVSLIWAIKRLSRKVSLISSDNR